MKDIPEREAKALLSKPLHCIDAGNWEVSSGQPGTYVLAVGLVDQDGARTQLQAEFRYRHSYKTNIDSYTFSIFQRQPWGSDRVYQLDVRKYPMKSVSEHNKPHEHLGDRRINGDLTWLTWTFDEILARFKNETGVQFDPEITNPLDFVLTGC